jgi:8-oxo-dGTP pyrophosphatase MutT (NUDIX family)
MPDDGIRIARDHIIGAFDGPGIDPPSLDDVGDTYGWVSQDKKSLPKRITPAAVLVPLVEHEAGMTVLLTQRPGHLKSHPGQISFPGGKTEPHDDTPEDTALRETEEEIGLPREKVDLVGRLGQRTTGSGFKVTPVVGLIKPPFETIPDPGEVEEIFEVPLSFVLNPANQKIETRYIRGVDHDFYVLLFENFYIWGLTARLLVALRDTLEIK